MTIFLIWSIKVYQQYFPDSKKRCCLFRETCSNYAVRMFVNKGFFGGVAAVAKRLKACRPGYKIVTVKNRMGILLVNGDFVNEPTASPVLLESYRSSMQLFSSRERIPLKLSHCSVFNKDS
jgi:putative component of membrane protein insertase Oxa1/YidC/SpoIIIJ protein YidD